VNQFEILSISYKQQLNVFTVFKLFFRNLITNFCSLKKNSNKICFMKCVLLKPKWHKTYTPLHSFFTATVQLNMG